ncbi:MAG: hypothetical protein HY727_07175 [Candidatus Rokubacteria bacterium]|nr:hypothetical protein [Candidatus Rokubacteria bacterium]
MGLRGPLPTAAPLRAVRNSHRRRRASAGLAPEIERLLLARAQELHRIGLALLKRAERKPTGKTPSNGEQASPLFSAAHKCFAEADRIYLRLGRLQPDSADEESLAADPDPLEIFRRAKH